MKIDESIREAIESALQEDKADRDITSRLLIHSAQEASAYVVAREKGVLCGIDIAREIFRTLDRTCMGKVHSGDGDRIFSGQKLMTVHGKMLKLLAAERTALNFLQHLSGVATLTKKYADAVKGTKAKIYDTRKTIPTLRGLQKYAVRCGGGYNHRLDLSQMALVKDNHLEMIRGHERILTGLKARLPKNMLLEVEAKNMDEVTLALDAQADIIMLDNMTLPQMKEAVRFIKSSRIKSPRKGPLVEVSGGITLKNVAQTARLGVDRISVGALTHSAPALDMSLDIAAIKE